MNKTGLILLLSAAVTVCVALGNEGTSTQQYSETLTEVKEMVDALAVKVKKLDKDCQNEYIELGGSSSNPATSCKEIFDHQKKHGKIGSGYFWLKNRDGGVTGMYCDMTRTCGGVTGGWTRVAELDTTDQYKNKCPLPLSSTTQGGKNLCARAEAAAGCSEVNYETIGVPYSEVCGRVIGYQFGSPDGVTYNHNQNINGGYLDGVSLTQGSPRQHIWSFLARSRISNYGCDCSSLTLPYYMGSNYFCDTGNPTTSWQAILYNDPLWDGNECLPSRSCCTINNPPWFHKKLGAISTNNIDMRVCRDEARYNEDVLLEKVEIYIR